LLLLLFAQFLSMKSCFEACKTTYWLLLLLLLLILLLLLLILLLLLLPCRVPDHEQLL
jgi:hypothetical protein